MEYLETDDKARELSSLIGYKFDNWGRALNQPGSGMEFDQKGAGKYPRNVQYLCAIQIHSR